MSIKDTIRRNNLYNVASQMASHKSSPLYPISLFNLLPEGVDCVKKQVISEAHIDAMIENCVKSMRTYSMNKDVTVEGRQEMEREYDLASKVYKATFHNMKDENGIIALSIYEIYGIIMDSIATYLDTANESLRAENNMLAGLILYKTFSIHLLEYLIPGLDLGEYNVLAE